jgi:hypothetical protein
MPDMKPETVISGLLAKRADLFNEAERIRDRLAEIRNDIGAVDRVLGTLGYAGDLDAEMPRQKRNVLFGPGELTRAILDELRTATGPLASLNSLIEHFMLFSYMRIPNFRRDE